MKHMQKSELPPALRKFNHLIEEVSDEREYDAGIWVYLVPGYINIGEVHFVHEDTIRECALDMQNVIKCECKECVEIINSTKEAKNV
jgi:hypothetical protein